MQQKYTGDYVSVLCGFLNFSESGWSKYDSLLLHKRNSLAPSLSYMCWEESRIMRNVGILKIKEDVLDSLFPHHIDFFFKQMSISDIIHACALLLLACHCDFYRMFFKRQKYIVKIAGINWKTS